MKSIPLLVLLGACGGNIWVEDAFNNPIQPFFSPAEDAVSSPYLQDATFLFRIEGAQRIVSVSELESSDPDILFIGPTENRDVDDAVERAAVATAVSAGTVTLTVVDDRGRVRRSLDVTVSTPDRVELHPIQRVVVLANSQTDLEDGGATTGHSVFTDSTAEFELWPYASGALLAGSAAPTVVVSDDERDALLFEEGDYHQSGLHDVIAASPTAVGSYTFELEYPTAGTFTHSLVATDTVASLTLECQADANSSSGTGYCLAQARTDTDAPLYGVFPAWQVQEQEMEGTGDLLEFTGGDADAVGTVDVVATFGELSASGRYAGLAQGASVRNSNDVVACSSAPLGVLWLAGPGLLLLGLRRRTSVSAR